MSELNPIKNSKGYIIGWEAATPIQTVPATITPVPAAPATPIQTPPRPAKKGK